MKSTIKLDGSKSLVIEPGKDGVNLSLKLGGYAVGSMVLGADTVGAVLAAIEFAAEGMKPAPVRPVLL